MSKAAKKAWITRRKKYGSSGLRKGDKESKVTDLSLAGKKAWGTRKRKKVGKRVAKYRRQIMLNVKNLLKEWDKSVKGKEVCVVCGDGMPKTILQRHHINPFDKSDGQIWLCASCHNIFNTITDATTIDDVKRDLNLRHKRATSP